MLNDIASPRLKSAIVGAGNISVQHINALQSQGLSKIVGVCDLSKSLAMSSAEKFSIPKSYTNFEKMLVDTKPDVVHITTPPASHFTLAKMALENGAHIIVEKPITLAMAKTQELLGIADQKSRFIVEDYNYLFSETIQKLQKLVREDQMGRIVHIEIKICLPVADAGSPFVDQNIGHWVQRTKGGVVADFATHMCYLTHSFIGPVQGVKTSFRKTLENTPLPSDEFRASIDTAEGTANLFFSSSTKPDTFLVKLWGTRGVAEAHLFEPRFISELTHGRSGPLVPLRNGIRMGIQSIGGAFSGLGRKLNGGPGSYDGLWELLRRTYACLQESKPMPVTHQEILEVNQMVHAVLEQANDEAKLI
ncbi:putative oxidoreductase YcjS [Roseimaritima multifibrata]|uniref:Putative oxidoreductase YcjS n=1 Tax=Roseimaritima multifibrata TaxID=1930274 RepID=A0A517MMH9_9BACT|nr:Gfo/Idh/MocA family oxidoreductase [Roseimaritima multifibrata]QDS96082.1 putative oxidoreductase YcjS [Roseimaritima multifibrata]